MSDALSLSLKSDSHGATRDANPNTGNYAAFVFFLQQPCQEDYLH